MSRSASVKSISGSRSPDGTVGIADAESLPVTWQPSEGFCFGIGGLDLEWDLSSEVPGRLKLGIGRVGGRVPSLSWCPLALTKTLRSYQQTIWKDNIDLIGAPAIPHLARDIITTIGLYLLIGHLHTIHTKHFGLASKVIKTPQSSISFSSR